MRRAVCKSDVAGLHGRTVFDKDFHRECRVECGKNPTGYVDTGQNAFFFDQEFGTSHLVGGNATKRGMVAIADVFGKGQGYQVVNQSTDIGGLP